MSPRVLEFSISSSAPIGEVFSLALPVGAKILSAQEQQGTVCIWALCTCTEPVAERRFVFTMTGQEIPADPSGRGVVMDRHLATLILDEDATVIHLFELEQLRV